jgi:hypothetical protein
LNEMHVSSFIYLSKNRENRAMPNRFNNRRNVILESTNYSLGQRLDRRTAGRKHMTLCARSTKCYGRSKLAVDSCVCVKPRAMSKLN